MGRVKLKIKKLETTNGRQATYAKRKSGIMKKAKELSILCGIDIILLVFSPTGKPSLCVGNHSFEEIIAKFAQLTPQERAKRKLENLEALKKTFKKLDHEVHIADFLVSSCQTLEDLASQLQSLQKQLSEVHRRLSYWTDIDRIFNIEHLDQLENSLRESLRRIRTQKDILEKQQLASLECNGQFLNGMRVPFTLGAEQPFPPFSLVHNEDSQHILLSPEPSMFLQRDAECAASSSFGTYPSYYGMGRNPDLSASVQESDLNFIFNELNGNLPVGLQLPGQYPYLPHNVNLLNDARFQASAKMNLQENLVDFHGDGSFETPKSGSDNIPESWASSSGPFSVPIFEDNIFSRVAEGLVA